MSNFDGNRKNHKGNHGKDGNAKKNTCPFFKVFPLLSGICFPHFVHAVPVKCLYCKTVPTILAPFTCSRAQALAFFTSLQKTCNDIKNNPHVSELKQYYCHTIQKSHALAPHRVINNTILQNFIYCGKVHLTIYQVCNVATRGS